MLEISKADALHLVAALEAADKELEALEVGEDWFVSDSRDYVASGLEILYGLLGIEPPPKEEEDD